MFVPFANGVICGTTVMLVNVVVRMSQVKLWVMIVPQHGENFPGCNGCLPVVSVGGMVGSGE